jgi:hypothetical protein
MIHNLHLQINLIQLFVSQRQKNAGVSLRCKAMQGACQKVAAAASTKHEHTEPLYAHNVESENNVLYKLVHRVLGIVHSLRSYAKYTSLHA